MLCQDVCKRPKLSVDIILPTNEQLKQIEEVTSEKSETQTSNRTHLNSENSDKEQNRRKMITRSMIWLILKLIHLN